VDIGENGRGLFASALLLGGTSTPVGPGPDGLPHWPVVAAADPIPTTTTSSSSFPPTGLESTPSRIYCIPFPFRPFSRYLAHPAKHCGFFVPSIYVIATAARLRPFLSSARLSVAFAPSPKALRLIVDNATILLGALKSSTHSQLFPNTCENRRPRLLAFIPAHATTLRGVTPSSRFRHDAHPRRPFTRLAAEHGWSIEQAPAGAQ
jgi:hypothetical protein